MYFVRGRAISGFFGFFGIFCYFFAGGEDSPSSIFKNRRWNQHRVRCGLRQKLKNSKKSGDLRHHLLRRYWRPAFVIVFFVIARWKWTLLKVNYWFVSIHHVLFCVENDHFERGTLHFLNWQCPAALKKAAPIVDIAQRDLLKET